MTNHEIAVLLAWVFGVIWLGMLVRIIVKAIMENVKYNSDLQGQEPMPVPRPFGRSRLR